MTKKANKDILLSTRAQKLMNHTLYTTTGFTGDLSQGTYFLTKIEFFIMDGPQLNFPSEVTVGDIHSLKLLTPARTLSDLIILTLEHKLLNKKRLLKANKFFLEPLENKDFVEKSLKLSNDTNTINFMTIMFTLGLEYEAEASVVHTISKHYTCHINETDGERMDSKVNSKVKIGEYCVFIEPSQNLTQNPILLSDVITKSIFGTVNRFLERAGEFNIDVKNVTIKEVWENMNEEI